MQLRPTITFDQYKAVFGAIAKAKPKIGHKPSWRYYAILAVACLAFGLASQFPPTRVPTLTICAAWVVLWACYKPVIKRSQENCLKRFYDEEQAKLNDQVLTIEESGISCNQGDGRALSHHTWASFIRRIDMPDAFLFLPSPNTFIRLPTTTLTSTEQDLIRDWSATIPTRNLGE